MLKKLSINSALLFCQQAMNMLLPIIAMPLVVSRYGLDLYGVLVLCQALVQYFIVVIDYGFNITATSYIAVHSNDEQRLSYKLISVYITKCVALLFSLLVMVFLTVFFDSLNHTILWICFIAVAGQLLNPHWFLLGVEKLVFITALSVVIRVFALVGLFVLSLEARFEWFVLILTAPYFVVGGLGFCYVVRGRYFNISDSRSLYQSVLGEIKGGFVLFLSNFCTVVYTNSSVVVVSTLLGDYAAGIFGVAERLLKAFLGGVAVMSQAFFPYSSRASTSMAKLEFMVFIRKALYVFAAMSLVFVVFVLLFGDLVLRLFLPLEDTQAVLSVLQVLGLVPLFVAISNVIGVHILTNYGLRAQFGTVVVLSMFVFIVFMAVLAPWAGLIGVASAYLLAEFTTVVLMLFVLHWKLGGAVLLFNPKRSSSYTKELF